MAYNRTFNPDALPAFAEPERKQPAAKPTSSPPQNEQYGNKPPPPLPRQDNNQIQSNSYEGSGQRRQPSPDYRGNFYGGSGLGRPGPQGSPHIQQQGGFANSSSPPLNNNRFPPPTRTQQQGGFANSSSPPLNNSRFPPPTHTQQRPPHVSRHPYSPAPGGGGADPTLLPLFRAVDKTGTGQLTEKQLGAALVNGDWSSFDPLTVQMMIRMFDTSGSGTIGFEEFCGLWSFLASWRTLFDRFDTDRSGNISLDEFTNALTSFGYRLSPDFVRFLFSQYDKHRTNQLTFDLFVQSCISLKRMTDVFKRYDDDRDGFIQLSFEDFLTEILKQR